MVEADHKDFEAAREKAMKCGAAAFHVDDLKREFVEELIFRKSLKSESQSQY
jgi:argininosuccinate synthase